MTDLRRLAFAMLVTALLAACPSRSLAQAPAAPAAPAATGTVVLDTNGMWRMHQTLQPPVARVGGALKPLLVKAAWVDRATEGPAADWMKPDFDDHAWLRGPARLVCPTPYLARLCLRGKFTVTDAAKVQGLRLAVDYHGGVIVYVNGQELTRVNVAPGAAEVAEDYPADAFQAKEGGLLGFEAARRTVPAGDPRIKAIRRGIAGVEIPAKMLRAGVNVVAIDILRAPYPAVVDEKKDPKGGFWNFAWDNCQIDRVQLTASGGGGLVSAASRPAGFQVWNSNLVACDYDLDFGDAAEKIAPVSIAGARNGSFSGKVVVGDTKPIRGLKAVAGELKGPAGAIAASNVRVRYGLPWGHDEMVIYYGAYPYAADATQLSGLADQPPEEVPLVKKKAGRGRAPAPGESDPVPGAVAPIWITVNVPKDAKPGAYKGEVTIQAEGVKAVTVPVEVQVADFALPSPDERRTLVEMLQSPDTLAAEYETPLWSDRHWELIAESFRLMSDSGSRFVYVPLIAETNQGHEQSMVRWVKKADGTYDYDFTIMEKYLDSAGKNLGKPTTVVLYAWDVYMADPAKGGFDAQWQAERQRTGKGGVFSQGPVVTAWDAATGKGERLNLPRYQEANSEALWKPLYDQLRQRLAKRGLDKSMMIGMITDIWPAKEDAEFLAKVAPGVGWVAHTHSYGGGAMLHKAAPVSYRTAVWSIANAVDKSLMGWKGTGLLARYWRQGGFDSFPAAQWRHVSEFAITGNQRGTGRIGGDFWPVIKDKAGVRTSRIYARYPQSNWRNLDIYVSLLCPGPKGPAATHHYVQFLEGTQEAEARIVIEKALSDPGIRDKLGEELAGRCDAALDERLRAMQRCYSQFNNRLDGPPSSIGSTCGPGTAANYWFSASGWETRTQALFTLAGEVAKKVESK